MGFSSYRCLFFPLLRLLPPEQAHHLALQMAPFWSIGRIRQDPLLQQSLWGLSFPNPIGLAAGFDKDGVALKALANFGFGFVEAGTVTPKPQAGNPEPRLFRSLSDRAIINRMGFNNDGVTALAARLHRPRAYLLGANIGKNKDSADEIKDYIEGAKVLAPFADYLTINISSPNTPGLRSLQAEEKLRPLLRAIRPVAASKPIIVKIAPDLEEEEMNAIAKIALDGECDGLIVGNTTLSRFDHLDPSFAKESGGLSGRPLFELSTRKLFQLYRMTEGRIPLIGAGGIENAGDAYRKIRSGASLVQIYSALIFKGPGMIAHILHRLPVLIRRDGFSHLSQAIGADHR